VIDKKLSMLAENPWRGKARHELGEGVRSFPVGRYILFYRATPEGIDVIRVLHGARDLNAIFDRDD
jgi:toxin ParE1/3/4